MCKDVRAFTLQRREAGKRELPERSCTFHDLHFMPVSTAPSTYIWLERLRRPMGESGNLGLCMQLISSSPPHFVAPAQAGVILHSASRHIEREEEFWLFLLISVCAMHSDNRRDVVQRDIEHVLPIVTDYGEESNESPARTAPNKWFALLGGKQ